MQLHTATIPMPVDYLLPSQVTLYFTDSALKHLTDLKLEEAGRRLLLDMIDVSHLEREFCTGVDISENFFHVWEARNLFMTFAEGAGGGMFLVDGLNYELSEPLTSGPFAGHRVMFPKAATLR